MVSVTPGLIVSVVFPEITRELIDTLVEMVVAVERPTLFPVATVVVVVSAAMPLAV